MSEMCVFCENTETDVRIFSGREYHRCARCGGVFLDSRFFLDYAEEKKRYELHDNSLENKGYTAYLERFLASLFEYPAIKEITTGNLTKILDYGSGPEPSLATILEQDGRDVRYYDPLFAPDCVFFEQGADLVTCLEVAEHFRHPIRDFALLAEKVRLGGFLAIGTNLLEVQNGEELWRFFGNWWYRQDSTHVSFYTEKALRAAAASADLTWVGRAGPNSNIFKKIQAVSP